MCGGSQNIPKVVIVWSVKKDLINIGRFMVKPHNKLVRESGTRDVKDMYEMRVTKYLVDKERCFLGLNIQ